MDTAVCPACPALWMSPSLPSLAFASWGRSILKFFSLKKMNEGNFFCNHELPFMEVIKVVNRDSLVALFIYLYLFATYLSKPGLLTTNCCTNTRLKGHISPAAHNAAVSCSAHCWWAKPSVLLWAWSGVVFLFHSTSQITLWVFCPLQVTQFLDQVFRNEMWTSSGTAKLDFAPFPQTCILCCWKAFASEKMSVFHFS